MDKEQAFEDLTRRGVVKVTVEFSGGNDEGGADELVAVNAAGEPVTMEPGPLVEALEKPIYDRWGGFAGDFSVNGELVWNVAARTVTMSGSETVDHDFGPEEC